MSGGFFRGTSADQDTRFSNKTAKLLKTQKFAPELDQLVDMTKVKVDTIRPWIARRVTELLGFEDEVLINFIYGMLEGKKVDGKQIQIQITGFMEKNTGKFMRELWALLTSAQNSVSGVPQQFLDEKAEEYINQQAEEQRISMELQKKEAGRRIADQERSKKHSDTIESTDAAAAAAAEGALGNSNLPRGQLGEKSPRDAINGIVERLHSPSRSGSGIRSPSPQKVSRSLHHRKHMQSLSQSPHRSPYRAQRSSSPPRRRHSLRSPKRRRSPSYSRSPPRRRTPSRNSRRYHRRSPIHQRSPPPPRHRKPSLSPRRHRVLSHSPRRRRHVLPPSPVRRSRSPRRHLHPSPSIRRWPARSRSPRRRAAPSLLPHRRHIMSRSPRSKRPALSPPPRRHAARSRSPLKQSSLPLSCKHPNQSKSPALNPVSPSPSSLSPQGRQSLEHRLRSPLYRHAENTLAHNQRECSRSPSQQFESQSSQRATYSVSPQVLPVQVKDSTAGGSGGRSLGRDTLSLTVQHGCSFEDGSLTDRKIIDGRKRSPNKEPVNIAVKGGWSPTNSRELKKGRFYSSEASEEQKRTISSSAKGVHVAMTKHLFSGGSADEQHKVHIHRKSSNADGEMHRVGVHKGRSSKMNVEAQDVPTSPTSTEERKKALKKLRKEEKKMRKDGRRRKREERHKRREEKRAAKAAANAVTSVTPPPELDNCLDTAAELNPQEGERSDDDDRDSEQKRMENELRKKALDSIRARKGAS